MKIIVYGIGQYLAEHESLLPEGAEIIAYGDRAKEKATSCTGKKFKGLDVLLPSEIKETEYDFIYIATNHELAVGIYEELKEMKFPLEKVRFLYRRDSRKEWKYRADDTGVLISDIGGIKIRENSRNDQDVLVEVLFGNCYNLDIFKKNTVVVDFGMNVGAASLFFASHPNVEKVYGFEPFSDTYASALENIKLNDKIIQEKIQTFPYAVSDFEGDREIAVLTEFSGRRTTEINLLENVSDKRTTTVHYCEADKVLRGIIAGNEQKHIIIKMDVEGSEFAIFKSIGHLFRRFDAIVMEYHRDPEELLEVLRENEYRCIATGTKSIGTIYAINLNERIERAGSDRR